MLLRREVPITAALLAIVAKILAAFAVHVTIDQQSAINAIAAALVGLIVAVMVHDGIHAALTGFIQATIALALGFGLQWPPDQQALVMSVAATAVAMFSRTQSIAPVGPVTVATSGSASAPAAVPPPRAVP